MRRGILAVWMLSILLTPAMAAAAEDGGEASMTHRMMLLVLQLGVVLFAAKLGNILFEKLRLPGALGELAAGVAIGPYALGRLGFFGFEEGLFPLYHSLTATPELHGVAAVAAVVLMFTAGLETDLKLLLRYAVVGGISGIGGVIASFFLGAGAAVLGSHIFAAPVGLFSPSALFLGTITTATSVGITARVLSQRRQLESPEGVTILSAAVIDDVIGIILLAVVMGVVKMRQAGDGFDWAAVGVVAAKAVGVWLVATTIGLAASRRISVLLKWFGHRTAIAIMALGLALVLAGLFEEAGLAMIIGAFVMGLSLSRADIKHVVQEKLQPIYEFLVPVFFCVMGMQINLTALGSPGVLGFGVLYAAVAMASKVFGCGLPVLLVKFNLRGAARVGFGMAPRCEVALIIAGVGLGMGVLGAELFAAVILMVILNTVISSPVLVALFRDGRPGTRRGVDTREKSSVSVPFEFASVEMAQFMAAKIRAAFEADGFFVHLIHHERRLYQLRSDRTVIDMQTAGATLSFQCQPDDVPLVNAAMYEALAALEQTIRGLRQPLDTAALASRLAEPAPAPAAGPSLTPPLRADLIVPHMTATTKAEALDELLDVLCRSGEVADRAAAAEAVRDREQSMSTGLAHGIAIPHGKTDAVDRLVAAFGVQRAGIDFQSMDGEPATIFVMTLSPASRPAPHIRFMSDVARCLDAAGRQRVLAAETVGQLMAVLGGRPAAPREAAFRLADVLDPEAMSCQLNGQSPRDVIEELLALLQRTGRVADLHAARADVLAREAEMPTGLAEGVAIPHARTAAVDRLVAAVGLHREGVDFHAADGRPARIVVLALLPEAGANPYVQFVAALVKALTGEGRRRVLAAETPAALHAALTA